MNQKVSTNVDKLTRGGRPLSAIFAGLVKRVLILGNGRLASQIVQLLKAKRTSRVLVVGYVDHEQSMAAESLGMDMFLGSTSQLYEIVERHQVDSIVVCLENRRTALPVETLLDLKAMGSEVVDGHSLYEEEAGCLHIDSLRPSALVFSTGFRKRMLTSSGKRLFDLAASTIGLVVAVPLFLLIGILIKLDSAGPVFYQQMRVGLRGQPYLIWKFRSMMNDAEKSGPRWAQAHDPRISRVGWWLRKTRLDELPQLINVLKGEMSLVGPRPERPVFVQELRTQIPYYDIRHAVRPGITGWAQIRFRYGASAEDAHSKLQYDLYYVKNLSIALDARILLETIRVVLLGEGAR
ncbi:MAG: TIGR03013 family PEP-CTERM/XrtA system glycosyltransferase [Nitrospira sp.]|nr:TIGR03013 family PEP-CTERM/XrtA system glycosyltransferase [Nitrospira sp.]